MKLILSALILTAGSLSLNENAKQPKSSEGLVAQHIQNATFMERTPDFTDLYIIQTPDKGRLITIYCNASHCYKRQGVNINV